MKATNEQIIAEAKRRWGATPSADTATIEDFIIEVVRENWTPPEPVVDPDVLAFREWFVASVSTSPSHRILLSRGHYDNGPDANAYLAGARMAREQEQERAKGLVEYVEADVRCQSKIAIASLAKYRGEA